MAGWVSCTGSRLERELLLQGWGVSVSALAVEGLRQGRGALAWDSSISGEKW